MLKSVITIYNESIMYTRPFFVRAENITLVLYNCCMFQFGRSCSGAAGEGGVQGFWSNCPCRDWTSPGWHFKYEVAGNVIIGALKINSHCNYSGQFSEIFSLGFVYILANSFK